MFAYGFYYFYILFCLLIRKKLERVATNIYNFMRSICFSGTFYANIDHANEKRNAQMSTLQSTG